MNKKQLMIELAMPIVFMLMAVYIIVTAIPMESEGVFPIMSAGVLLLCAVYLFVEILIKHQQVVKLEGVNLKMVGITLLALVIYVFLLKKIGYIIDTFILCFFVIRSTKRPVLPCCVLRLQLHAYSLFLKYYCQFRCR